MTSGTPGTAGNPDGPSDGAAKDGRRDPDAVDGSDALDGSDAVDAASAPADAGWKRPAPTLTTDTARPEGGGRAAPGDASAPARQWPLLTVLGLAGIGLLVVGTDAFTQAFRIGTMLVGAALLVGAVMRRVLPSVGMLAVRSRFTDMITYGVMGGLIVLLALMVQPKPWLKIPFLEDVLHLTVT
ncbi:DUF3017 domain-containing protein [Streptomyces sp. NBC_00572]|uniref:DUF3017 domain-containing protein n=1 Tax=Streptomyces sp. NBC_00572 TaxID=2903664 RepID=UPI00224FEDC9|nr:DUF3017 domain-containing protein [Streptomyces sp. NBC_00572]MCX4982952.1 DUF3017 domain-containing protein [Streptomyces sp. NBC_00572]